jgi:hypothetical protein
MLKLYYPLGLLKGASLSRSVSLSLSRARARALSVSLAAACYTRIASSSSLRRCAHKCMWHVHSFQQV